MTLKEAEELREQNLARTLRMPNCLQFIDEDDMAQRTNIRWGVCYIIKKFREKRPFGKKSILLKSALKNAKGVEDFYGSGTKDWPFHIKTKWGKGRFYDAHEIFKGEKYPNYIEKLYCFSNCYFLAKEVGETKNMSCKVLAGIAYIKDFPILHAVIETEDGYIGIPFPDTIFKIVRIGTYEEADVDEDGEICINGPTVMKRYLDDINETKNVLKLHTDGKVWLHTGDVGYMNEDGIVFFKSRLKRMIVSSGYNIYPQYIEKVIMSHPAVETCAVIGIPHEYKKQVPKAYIVLRQNFDDTKELREDISEYCKKSISKYSLPAQYEYVKDIPKTKVGKVAFSKLEEKEVNEK